MFCISSVRHFFLQGEFQSFSLGSGFHHRVPSGEAACSSNCSVCLDLYFLNFLSPVLSCFDWGTTLF